MPDLNFKFCHCVKRGSFSSPQGDLSDLTEIKKSCVRAYFVLVLPCTFLRSVKFGIYDKTLIIDSNLFIRLSSEYQFV